MKKLILIVTLFIQSSLLFGQSWLYPIKNKELDVCLITQKADLLCWAASMEMIFKYHGQTLTQCDLTADYYDIVNEGPIPSGCDCNCICGLGSCTDNDNDCNGICNNGINFFDGRSPQYFDIIFSRHEYDSVEDNLKMEWKKVENQINNYRPFIAIVNETDSGGYHAVVVKGYLNLFNTLKFVSVNDPWPTYEERLINGAWLSESNQIHSTMGSYFQMHSFIHDIHPRTELSCSSKGNTTDCSEESLLFKQVKIYHKKMVSTTKEKISDMELEKLIKEKPNNTKIPLKLISLKTLSDSTKRVSSLKESVMDNQLINILFTTPNNVISSTLEKKDGIWKTVEISQSRYLLSPDIKINNSIISLKNNQFEIIKYPPFEYIFYSFSYNGNSYLSPVETYSIFKKGDYETKIAYSELEILQILKQKTLAYNKQKKEPKK